ncbi:hypothetical protein CSOJ01_03897 [Colletotrichum sojae]|uniref:Uncharacterized protein n=1 Tax=Colletotrichum sojae TaxID=2175907 RepID=A0A8H6JK21_9PEZI|nr:hypothetical protein CSOJ01_03897 [Colletotrichum sojae]
MNRFYESLVLLTSLREVHHRNGQTRAPSDAERPEPSENPSRTFECFVNKLAQVCDSRRGGDTVTSLAILRHPDRLQYVFASNQRNAKDIEKTSEFVYSLLYYVGSRGPQPESPGGDESSTIFRHLLRNILNFNSKRIRCYAKGLAKHLGNCIADCERDDSSDASLPTECEILVRAATVLLVSPTYGRIVDRAKIGRIDQSLHWSELEHFIGRLASYTKAVQAIMGARKRFPELFEVDGFEVQFVASSTPLPNPMMAFQAGLPPIQRRSARPAHDIISRMTSDKDKIATYRHYAGELQRCGLDDRIAEQCGKPMFQPVVHSEILLLEWLLDEYAEETHSVPFYGDVKYIGCSKPACRLCDCYFAAHNSGIRARPPHPNVYANWTIPAILDESDGEVSREKTRMVDTVLGKIREDAFREMREKVSERKRFDSNTDSSLPTFQSHASVLANLDDLSSQISGLSIATRERYPHRVIKGKAPAGDDAWSVVAEEGETEDNDDGGGMIVFSGRKMRFISAGLRVY